MNRIRTRHRLLNPALYAAIGVLAQSHTSTDAQPYPNWLGHDRTRLAAGRDSRNVQRSGTAGKAAVDAVVLFGGNDLSQWVGWMASDEVGG